MRALLTGLIAVVAVSGCAMPSTVPVNSTASPVITRSTEVTPTGMPSSVDGLNRLVLNPPSKLGPAWYLAFKIGYGSQPALLGTYLGGDGNGLHIGPDYGTQAPDGTWWFLDPAKVRLAHYSATGAYLGQSLPPKRFLGGGRFLEYQRLTALADGTLVAHSTSVNEAGLLIRSPDGAYDQRALRDYFSAQTTDGKDEYGFMAGRLVRLDPRTGRDTPVTRFVGPGGSSFSVTRASGGLTVVMRTGTATLPVVAASFPTLPVQLNVEATPGADGVLNLLLTGIVEPAGASPSTVIGFVRLDARARVVSLEDVRDPTSAADPASGLHLGVRLDDSSPWLMFVDSDGVRVYRRG